MEFLQPKFTVPFASFIYFANTENQWMNGFSVTPKRVMDLELPGVNFMYPGDEWDSSVRSFRSAEAVEKYMADIARVKPVDPMPPAVSASSIRDSANRMMQTLRSQFGRLLVNRIPPELFYLHDLDKVLVVDPVRGCEVADVRSRRAGPLRFVQPDRVVRVFVLVGLGRHGGLRNVP